MTLLGERMKQLEDEQKARRVECGKLMRIAAQELATTLSELFDDALGCNDTSDESELVKAVVLKQPSAVCIISVDGAELRVDLKRYKEGALKDLGDLGAGMFLDITAQILSEKYSEYRFRRDGSSIMVTEPLPPPMSVMEWLRSLVKPKEIRY